MARLHSILGIALSIATWFHSLAVAADNRQFRIESPDGKNAVTLLATTDQQPSNLRFSIARNGIVLIQQSPLGMQLAGHGNLANNLEIVDHQSGELDESFELPWGKTRTVANRCRWLRAQCKSGEVRWEIELRAYDDGVALRYVFPAQPELGELVVADDAGEFDFAGDPTVHFMICKNFRSDHENEYQRARLAELPTSKLIDLPFLAVWPTGVAAAVTEARIRDFPGMYLERQANKSALECRLSPLPDRSDACFVGQTPFASPWRVVLLADHAGKLIESNLLVCLNDPPAPTADFSWARPGKSTWHWWNGTDEAGLGFKTGMNFATHKRYIDFCARNNIAYHAVVADDRPWHVQTQVDFQPGPDTDILTPRPELEFPRILEYAKAKGVSIRLWVHWKALDPRLEEAFAQYENWGIRGLMVDFLDRDDQQMVNFCERVLDSAARHHLHVQFHGSYKPSGEQRTFPHLFNREGVLNLEYLKWSKRCTPQHNVGVAYTRMLAGPLDYHLGGFRSATSADFVPRNANPLVLGTRCHHLAMYVVYENPMPMVSDSPQAYENQTGFDFITAVPTTWDETRFLAGEPGEYVVVARRQGRDWYLGGMTDAKRELSLPLDFLTPGDYGLTLYQDGATAAANPNAVERSEQPATHASRLHVELAPAGGFAAVLRPRK